MAKPKRQIVKKKKPANKEKKPLRQKSAPEKPEQPKPVQISAAKGRPMLVWVGKKPLRHVTAFPAQHVESFHPEPPIAIEDSQSAIRPAKSRRGAQNAQSENWFDWPEQYPHSGLLFHGDNKEVLAHLLANGFRGKVKLIYIDPPFDSGADYVRKVQLRSSEKPERLEAESYTLGEQIQYTDIWANDSYLQFMYERLLLLRELLDERGSLFLHSDDARNYHLRMLLEEVFPNAFRNEIIWKRSTSTGLAQKRCGTLHDTIYWYSKSEEYTFNMQYHAYEEEYLHRAIKDETGRLYIPIPTGNPGPRPNLYYEYKGYWPHPNGYKWTRAKMEDYDNRGLLVFPREKSGRIQFKQYVDEMGGVKLQDLWTDLYSVNPVAQERTPYPTQKPESLLGRIIKMASDPNDVVLDCFIGSGTAAAVAQKLGRRWIGCDINKGAIQTTSKRLQTIIQEQVGELERKGRQVELGFAHADTSTSSRQKADGTSLSVQPPAQLSFEVYRVNDYDLQIQHNEAVNLACEHIGVTRTRADAFFDGTLGRRLVKIVPFNHPLSPLDLEEVKRELSARPGEDRDVVVVSLGKELAADAWAEEWNRLRKKGDVPNKLEIIELRTDPKYGKFIKHEPARARVKVSRRITTIHVVIEDFISPTILERLSQQTGVVKPHIDDWRSMVDCVMIDADYNGEVFNVVFSDVPEKKSDVVKGEYQLDAPRAKTNVAVKIVDMLGEEVVEVKEV